jgi:hypothetical protein
MATIQSAGQELPITFTNHFLAHLQVATADRFGEGKGFFLTATIADKTGAETTHSHWLHPTSAVSFHYDVTDESNERISPVELNHDEVEALTKAMASPHGVRGSESVWWPFADQP